MSLRCHLLHFYKISGIYPGKNCTCALYLKIPKIFFIAIKKKFLCTAMPPSGIISKKNSFRRFNQSISLPTKKSTLSTQSNKRFRENLTNTQMYYSITNKVLLFHICRIFIHINETTKIRIHSKDAVELFSKNNILIGDIASELFNCNPGQIGKITYLLNPKELLHSDNSL